MKRRIRTARRAWIASAAIALLPLVGCAPDYGGRVEVTGRLACDGQPLETGSISFVPLDVPKGKTVGGTIAAGEYKIAAERGPLPGKYRVEIKSMRKTGKQIVSDMHSNGKQMVDQIEQFLPARYNAQSTLTADVPAVGPAKIDFDLRTGS